MAERDLLDRLEKATGSSNELDVAIEVALFEPDARHTSARANSAGTKVIYTRRGGGEDTHWAPDHTISAESRRRFIALFRALEAKQ